jgi:protein involved in polysaccharide export with SLBB domain
LLAQKTVEIRKAFGRCIPGESLFVYAGFFWEFMKFAMNGENGENRSGGGGRQRSCLALVPLFFLLLNGCAANRNQVDPNLMAGKGKTPPAAEVAQQYLVGCPDVLEVAVAGQGGLNGRYTVGPDGRVELDALDRPQVEGRTVPAIERLLADQAGVPVDKVHVQVADYQSQEIYLYGQVTGLQRAVPYHGPETVLELLLRTGGITPGAAPADVYVIRTRVAQGQRPEVFHVDLHAIVLKHDQRTNLRLCPFDQIHVGETRQARVERSIPPWLRPLYQNVWATPPLGSQDQLVTLATREP